MNTKQLVISVLFSIALTSIIAESKDVKMDQEVVVEIPTNVPPDKFFLEKIFTKYGDDGTMTFEGFEHLLYNLGLGGEVFEAPHDISIHRINGTFSKMHDEAHRHKRSGSHKDFLNVTNCLSPQEIMEVYGVEYRAGVSINIHTFLNVCPALVYQLDQRSCIKISPISKKQVEAHLAWIYASISILIISATGLLGVAVMPIIHSKVFSQLLHFLVALAIGTLAGDALLHLLPHSLSESSEHSHHDLNGPIFKYSFTLLAILVFYVIESALSIFTEGKPHGHSHARRQSSNSRKDVYEMDVMLSEPERSSKPITPASFMIIIGDALHNVTDGLAIGAAFSNDLVTGFATSLAVLCHELPHELGDFAVLLKSGMSMKKALGCNILSSVLSFLGMAGGLFLAEDHASASQWIYAATAGTFLYIALVDLLPEIKCKGEKKLSEFILAFIGILLGYIIMLSIALYEESMVGLFSD